MPWHPAPRAAWKAAEVSEVGHWACDDISVLLGIHPMTHLASIEVQARYWLSHTWPRSTHFRGIQIGPTTTTADKQCKQGHDEEPVDYLEERLIFQAVKTLVTISILLLKIYDTCGWTLEDMDTLSQSGCTVRDESIWRVKKQLLVILSPRDSEHMHFWKRWSISDTYESDSAWPLTMVQSEA